MTFESTGEVRRPMRGEYYLSNNPYWIHQERVVMQCEGESFNYDDRRVIMRPVREVIGWEVVIPFDTNNEAINGAFDLAQDGWVGAFVRPVYDSDR